MKNKEKLCTGFAIFFSYPDDALSEVLKLGLEQLMAMGSRLACSKNHRNIHSLSALKGPSDEVTSITIYRFYRMKFKHYLLFAICIYSLQTVSWSNLGLLASLPESPTSSILSLSVVADSLFSNCAIVSFASFSCCCRK